MFRRTILEEVEAEFLQELSIDFVLLLICFKKLAQIVVKDIKRNLRTV